MALHNYIKINLLLSIFLLSSCMVGPNYVPPKVNISNKFKEANDKKIIAGKQQWKPIHPQDAMDRGEWWTIFNDPILNDLEKSLNHCNQSIANAQANYLQSLAMVDEVRASLYPTLTGAFSLFRQRQSGGSTSVVGSGGTTGTATTNIISKAKTITIYSAFLNASWEPDLWGGIRRSIEAQGALAESNAALIGVTRLSAQGSLAQYYFELRMLDKNQHYLDETVRAYHSYLKIIRNQYSSGIAQQSAILQAQIQFDSAQTAAIQNRITRAQYEHAIAVLIGLPPAEFTLKPLQVNLKPPAIPLMIPSQWLERRPDIAQAERLVQQASALIGVAIAAYFPDVTLTANLSAAGHTFQELIHKPAISWSAGTQASELIFDGGLRSATVRGAQAQYWAQVANYRQVVLTAFQDVEDNLVSLRLLEEQSVVQDQQSKEALHALKIAQNQYNSGTIPRLDVLTAKISALTILQTSTQIDGMQMLSAVGLIKSLGGGWNCKVLHHKCQASASP